MIKHCTLNEVVAECVRFFNDLVGSTSVQNLLIRYFSDIPVGVTPAMANGSPAQENRTITQKINYWE